MVPSHMLNDIKPTKWIIKILFFILLVQFECLTKELVIIDTDAGADDAMAILMILSSNETEVEAITCVQGNTGVHNVSLNVLKTLDVAGRLDIPVYVGSPSGLVYTVSSDLYFGYDGLGDFYYPNPPSTKYLMSQHAAIALAEKVKEKPNAITIVAIGPLTNIVLASHINPDFFNQVKKILIMGGSYKGEGNLGPGIEFNVYADVEASTSFYVRRPRSLKTLVVPYEAVSDNAYSMDWRINTLGKISSKKMQFLNLAERKVLGGKQWKGFDQTLAAVLLNPEVATSFISGEPHVNTTTNPGEMNILEPGTVNIVTNIDRASLKSVLLKTLS